MTPAARLFRDRLERRARALAGDLRAALLKAYDQLAASLTDAELTRLIEAGNLDELITDADARRALLHVQARLRAGVESAAQSYTRDIPIGTADIFDVMQANAVRAILALNTRVMQGLSDEVRASVRTYVADALAGGRSTRATVAGIRDVIGLAPNQVKAVENFRLMLETGDAEALTRTLRDRRFDATLRRMSETPLTPAQVDRMVDAYRRRFVAYNADVTIRTAAVDAEKLAHQMAWEQAVDRGDVDAGSLTKRWSGTLDDRERPTHLAMEGETVPFDQPYSNGQQVPGDTEFNCRCVSIFEANGARRMGAGAAAGLFPDEPGVPFQGTKADQLTALRTAARNRRRGVA